jgi:hypothetical protein
MTDDIFAAFLDQILGQRARSFIVQFPTRAPKLICVAWNGSLRIELNGRIAPTRQTPKPQGSYPKSKCREASGRRTGASACWKAIFEPQQWCELLANISLLPEHGRDAQFGGTIMRVPLLAVLSIVVTTLPSQAQTPTGPVQSAGGSTAGPFH